MKIVTNSTVRAVQVIGARIAVNVVSDLFLSAGIPNSVKGIIQQDDVKSQVEAREAYVTARDEMSDAYVQHLLFVQFLNKLTDLRLGYEATLQISRILQDAVGKHNDDLKSTAYINKAIPIIDDAIANPRKMFDVMWAKFLTTMMEMDETAKGINKN